MSCCSHAPTAVGVLGVLDLEQLLSNPSCDICRLNNEKANLWLCLYPDCYMLGCADTRGDHSTTHNNSNPAHCVQLNIGSWRAWCYLCNNELLLNNNKPPLRGVFAKKRKNTVKADNVESAESWEVEGDTRGLVGLSNLGNTCYMNAALQCLSNIPAVTNFFLECPDLVPTDIKPNLSLAFRNLVGQMWSPTAPTYIEPSSVLYAIKSAFPAFRGFQQHDSQEFLRCFMDQLHKEMSEPILEAAEDEEEESKVGDSENIESLSEMESNSSSSSEPGEEYETASEESVKNQNTRKRKHEDQPDRDSGLGSCSRLSESESTSKQGSGKLPGSPTSLSDQEYLDASSDPGINNGPGSPAVKRDGFAELRCHKPRVYRSIVTDIFDGKLVSSIKCLSCDRVSKTAETFQDLSLPIPSQEALTSIRQRLSGALEDESGWLHWMWKWVASWFYGPDVTLQDCLAFFFSEDELKGDNMYSCEKCKKLRNGLKFSKVTQLPDALTVHLKRFRHDFSFASKISTRVAFPLAGLDLSPWIHKDCISSQVVYDLTGVICHHGTAGGGHYTSFNLNPTNGLWYHFDDSIVTQVDSSYVSSVEAYVLFYRKKGDQVFDIRRELGTINPDSQHSLVKYYVSKPWLVKLNNMAEPGPIDNRSVLCPHGGVLPHRVDAADRLCTPLPPAAWRILHERFGGSAAVTSLKTCQACLAAARAEERQRHFELSEFKLLQDQDKNDLSGAGDCFLLVHSWFSVWEAWVVGKAKEPPGPINNRSLFVQRGSSVSLRPNTDHFKLSEDIWSLFLSLYSGGPEVVLRPGGGIKVTTPNPERIARIAARLQARCNDTNRFSESN